MCYIRKLLGYENIDNIKIPNKFKSPNDLKMQIKREYYNKYKKFQSKVILNKNSKLLDGYTTYLIAREKNIKYIKVTRI